MATQRKLRIAFMGTPEFSVSALQALVESDHEVVCVYSQPPRPKGRGKKVQPSPVHLCAEAAGIEVRTPINFKSDADLQKFKDLNLDVAIVAAYGLILPIEILDAPKYGCINIHASLLPRWRGAAPIHRAILAGDEKTGITLMKMDVGLDTGDMIAMERVTITDQTTLPELHDALSELGAKMLIPLVDELATTGQINATPQTETGMTYAKMLHKHEGHIDWNDSATDIERRVRALHPWPGTWGMLNDKRIKILSVSLTDEKTDHPAGTILSNGKIACGENSVLQLDQIQPENKKPMDIKVALNGGHITQGDVIT